METNLGTTNYDQILFRVGKDFPPFHQSFLVFPVSEIEDGARGTYGKTVRESVIEKPFRDVPETEKLRTGNARQVL